MGDAGWTERHLDLALTIPGVASCCGQTKAGLCVACRAEAEAGAKVIASALSDYEKRLVAAVEKALHESDIWELGPFEIDDILIAAKRHLENADAG